MSSSIGKILNVSIFGGSHGQAIGALIEGLPAGEKIDEEELYAFMLRRQGGKGVYTTQGVYTTPRKETDKPVILSGMRDCVITGEPLCVIIENKNVRSADYEALADTPRPSHADYPAGVKYKGNNDTRGGGHFSGRLTAPICVAGGIAKQILGRKGVFIGAHASEIGGISDEAFDPVGVKSEVFGAVASKNFPVINDISGARMLEEISKASACGDSVGGVVECAAIGLPVGLGEPLFDGVENRIAAAAFALGGVRGIEFGTGFNAARMRGSEHNDVYTLINGEIKTKTNHHGGALGGLTTSMPIIFRVAFKPTASISIRQQTVDLKTMQPAEIEIGGRHDPCIVPRAVPCVEAIAAITILDFMLMSK